MILGMTLATFTLFHVVISLVGIASGLIVAYGLLGGKRFDTWTAIFLLFTVLTSVTGFFFPITHLTPGLVVGVISLVVLAFAIFARYALNLNGIWRLAYVISAMLALYLNVFVLVAQLFLKVPALKALAPTQSELPFKIAQAVALTIFIVLGALATIKFRDEPARTERLRSAAA